MSQDDSSSNQQRWRRVRTIFSRALEQPAAKRNAFVAGACEGDPSLHAEVEGLLRAHDAADDFLEAPAETLFDAGPDALQEGETVGPYRLTREIGRGGMGVVWLAERAGDDFEQRVALKVVKRGMDSDEILARFLRERRVHARLEHPNIARLMDGGVSAGGQPWFALEYVDGTPLLDYCRHHGLDVAARLRLFRRICAAVQHAHRSLVVHRDLKPSNILVNAKGEPKLLDFGIAKLLGDDDGEPGGGLTRSGARMMTPLYAAPEQVLGQPVTTATDVYSLGVILYELLTGRLPYPPDQTRGAALARSIVEGDPERPSTMARRQPSRSGDHAGAGAPSDARRLSRQLAGDLDRICLMALRKEPERRYESAQALADDITRYLDGYPVRAQPDSLGYRTRKFVGRNRVAVAAATLVLVSLAVGLSISLWQAERASRQAARAEQVKEFLIEIFQINRPGTDAGTSVTAREILEAGVARLDEQLAGQPDLHGELLQVVGSLYVSLGLLDEAELLLQRSLEVLSALPADDRELYAAGLVALGEVYWERTDYATAETAFREAVGRYRRHSGRDRQSFAFALRSLAIMLSEASKYEQAEPLHYEALAMDRRLSGDDSLEVANDLHNLAQHLKWQGRSDEAEPLYRAALAIKLRELGNQHISVAGTQSNLGVLLGQRGDYVESEELLRDALETHRRVLGDEHPDTALTLNNLSMLNYVTANYEAAEPLIREALALNRKLFGEDNDRVATNLANLANLLAATGRLEESEKMQSEALAIRRQVIGNDAHQGDRPAERGERGRAP